MNDDLVKLCKRLSKHAHAQLSSADLDRIANRIEGLEAALKLHQDLKDALAGDKINLVSELRQVKAELATARRDALEEAANEVDCGGCVNVGCVDPTNCWHKAAQDIRALIAQEEPTT